MVKRLALFDVDGTLTKPRLVIEDSMGEFMAELRKVEGLDIGVVGGSDLKKQREQLGRYYDGCWEFNFAENGLDAFKNGGEELIARQNLAKHLGEGPVQKLINWCLGYMSKIELPVKRGTFIEFRNGMLNISPIGRSCSQEERDAFEVYDNEHKIRAQMIEEANKEDFIVAMNLTFSIGGQISFDCFPNGWDKTYCLQFVETLGYDEIHFFGDKTHKGGNDHEIYEDSRTLGHVVTSPDDCMQQCREIFGL